MLNKVVFALLALCCVANAQVLFGGKCPTSITLQPDFNVEKYLGKWHEYAKYLAQFEPNGKCNAANYALNKDGTVSVHNTQISTLNNKLEEISGSASLVENSKLKVTFPVAPAVDVTSNYWVLGTDYDNYSVVYSCSNAVENAKDVHKVFAWILTREAFPSVEILSKAISTLNSHQISLKNFVSTVQYDCNAK